MSNNPTLQGVSLCAIVRDEMINPAGGIEDFIRCTVPFVAAAVIVDTGSKDGTSQKLHELQEECPQLEVFEKQFTDYADIRNFSLSKVKTPLALVLDADERLFSEDFEQLPSHIVKLQEQQEKVGLTFIFWNIYPNIHDDYRGGGHNPRLFRIQPQISFENTDWSRKRQEFLKRAGFRICSDQCLDTGIYIKHFRPSSNAVDKKYDQWYGGYVDTGKASEIAPSETPDFATWKVANPRRQQFT